MFDLLGAVQVTNCRLPERRFHRSALGVNQRHKVRQALAVQMISFRVVLLVVLLDRSRDDLDRFLHVLIVRCVLQVDEFVSEELIERYTLVGLVLEKSGP